MTCCPEEMQMMLHQDVSHEAEEKRGQRLHTYAEPDT